MLRCETVLRLAYPVVLRPSLRIPLFGRRGEDLKVELLVELGCLAADPFR